MGRQRAATLDLVIQAPELADAAVDAFAVACLARTVRRRTGCARLYDVPDDAATRKVTAALAAYWQCDAALIAPRLDWSRFRLLALDMDSTLISIECIDEIALRAGRGPEVAALTAAAMRGDGGVAAGLANAPDAAAAADASAVVGPADGGDFAASLRRRVALLAGVDAVELERIYLERVQLSPGAQRLLDTARAHGLGTLLVSGGFSFFAARLQARLGLDRSVANELEIVEQRLTGNVTGPAAHGGAIVDGAGKVRALAEACAALGCPTQAAIVVGDGANDLPMMRAAGMSVAYRAKPLVRAQAQQAIDYCGLDAIVEWFDWPAR